MNRSSKSLKKGLTVTWFGHSAFLFEEPDGKSVLFDPWLENPKAPSGIKETVKPDLILISHGHGDHLGNTIEIAQRTGAKVVSIHEIYLYLKSQGLTTATGMNKGGTMDVDGIKVTMVDAKHSSDIDVGDKIVPGGEAAGFVIKFRNRTTVYFAGDTALFGDMKIIGDIYKPDLAMIPIGDLYTMAPREAAIACKLLRPKKIIGMHYGTFPPLTGTPSELRKHLPAGLKKAVLELEPGRPVTV
jgi:L-ascorbate metabolism protein UlaG (beta-lactamase superfamily)